MSDQEQEITPASFLEVREKRENNVILIADDDAFLRTLIRELVESSSIVHEAENGKEACDLYRGHAPDIMFLDVNMPIKNGIDTLQTILGDDPDAFIVMMSGTGTKKNIEFIVKLGARGFLLKPVTREKVLQYIKRCPTLSSR